jgi:hypothetical protein
MQEMQRMLLEHWMAGTYVVVVLEWSCLLASLETDPEVLHRVVGQAEVK